MKVGMVSAETDDDESNSDEDGDDFEVCHFCMSVSGLWFVMARLCWAIRALIVLG